MVQSEDVTFSSTAGSATGYLARPGSEKPGVVVIQEWWGLVPHIKDIANRFAQAGYVALAPDLFHGKTTVEEAEAQHLLGGLDWGRAAQELTGAVRHLREVEGVTKVGVIGYCMGGALTIIAATQPGVDAYVAYYGFPPKGAAPLEKITAPGLLFFGEEEQYFSVPDAQAFAASQRAKGIDTDVTVYAKAGHAFFNDERPKVYNPVAAHDTWARTLAFFGRYLR